MPDDIIRDFARTFGGVEHRIELTAPGRGVRWYNDSIASSPSRTIAGLNSFPEKVILIAGGKDKGISYAPLGPVVNEHVKLLLLCGATAGVIRQAVEQAENYAGLEIIDVADYQDAVSIADSRAVEGDVVILSPASTSFDRFANFMERGRVFKEVVNALPEPSGDNLFPLSGGKGGRPWDPASFTAGAGWTGGCWSGRWRCPVVVGVLTLVITAAVQMRPLLASLATTKVSNTVTRIVSEAVYQAIEDGEIRYDGWSPLKRMRRDRSRRSAAIWLRSTTCRRIF